MRNIYDVVEQTIAAASGDENPKFSALIKRLEHFKKNYLPYTAPEMLGMRWHQYGDYVNASLPQEEGAIKEGTTEAKVLSVLMDKSQDELLELKIITK